jgi:DNA mismatch repair ATPase MutS
MIVLLRFVWSSFANAVLKDDSSIKYTYELEKGISTVQGGIQILKDMNYPQKILDQTQFVNSKI